VSDALVDIVIASFGEPGTPSPDLAATLDAVRCCTDVPHRVILERSTASAARNRNRALARASAPWICFLDDDALVTPGWCGGLLAALARHPAFTLAGPKLNLDARHLFCFGIGFAPPAHIAPLGYGALDDGSADAWIEPFAIPTTCLLVRRDAAAAAGPFDEAYGACQWEDVDYYLRLRAAGFRGLVTGAVTVFHRHRHRYAGGGDNEQRFLRRWGGRLAELGGAGMAENRP
jgi:O-antigen biosynthesis protein